MCQNSVILITMAILANNCLSEVNNGNNNEESGSLFSINIDPDARDGIQAGTLLAFEHCQSVFQWERWNCPKEDFERETKQHATREAAFTQAIKAAGMVHSITKNCSRGEIIGCGCNPKFEPTPKYYRDIRSQAKDTLGPEVSVTRKVPDNAVKWSWSGCSDDTTFGMRLVREMLKDSEYNHTVLPYVGRHNYRIGTEIIYRTMIKKCRCHGVSGSCSLQTCWMQLTSFPNVAKKLKEKYKKAKRMTSESIKEALALRNSVKRVNREKNVLASETRLIYLERSPDYCIPNATENWTGTKGRSCSRLKSKLTTSSERKSCRTLCKQCGYKVRKERRVVRKRCNCTFEWCCSVKCNTCTEIVEELYCN